MNLQSSSKPISDFVSTLKLNTVPLMTKETRLLCQIWQQEAIIIEKELELKQKIKELDELKKSFEFQRNKCPPSIRPSSARIVQLLRVAAHRPSERPLGSLLDEISFEFQEYRKHVKNGGNLPPSDYKEFRFWLREFNKELDRRLDDDPDTKTSKNPDATSDDVSHVSLNAFSIVSPNPSVADTVKEVSPISIDQKSWSTSKKPLKDISLHSESTFKTFDEVTPDDDSLQFSHSLPIIEHDDNLTPEFSKNVSVKKKEHNLLPSASNEESQDGSPETPPRARKLSYTLESPSPCVLEYFRNQALDNSQKSEKPTSATKSVVRNLNNAWNKENLNKKQAEDVSPDFRDSLEDIVNGCVENGQAHRIESSNGMCSSVHESYNEHLLSLSVEETQRNLKRTKAATTLQAYTRGFLTRRLMRTHRVETMKNVIKDAVLCAWGLYKEEAVTPSDLQLHQRLIQQVTAACYELHSIFFVWSTSEKLALIREDRERKKNPRPKSASSRPRTSDSESSSSRISSRSASRNRSLRSSTHTRSKSNEVEISRPTTLPSVPRSPSILNYKPWR